MQGIAQRKLVELLEQLRAGDESVRAQIDQLEQRRREDLRRIAEARAMLRREVDEEFMNLDAFEISDFTVPEGLAPSAIQCSTRSRSSTSRAGWASGL